MSQKKYKYSRVVIIITVSPVQMRRGKSSPRVLMTKKKCNNINKQRVTIFVMTRLELMMLRAT